jgi:tetratricopeptide (TPR) repeat protein
MKTLLILACLASISTLPALGQAGGGGGRRVPTPTRPRVTLPDPTSNSPTVFVTGKVVIADGGVLTEPASVQTICKGQKRTEAHTDSHGSFSFQFGGRFGSFNSVEYDADEPGRRPGAGQPERRDMHDCELQASLAGFTSDSIPLDGRFAGNESADVGRIVLHRLANVEGFTISATSAQAPGDAKKALQKGQEQQKKGKLDDARKSLETAVAIYPKFAVAWFELGRLQLQINDRAGARQSFEQSLAADSKYVNPYQGLTQLALREKNWKELTDFSEKLLALNPVSFPDAWLSNAIGNYCLQNFAAAENSARHGLQIDTEHRVLKLDYVLGITLLKRSNYEEAAQHLRIFLSHVTTPAETAEVQRQLDEIGRLTAAAQLTPAPAK